MCNWSNYSLILYWFEMFEFDTRVIKNIINEY